MGERGAPGGPPVTVSVALSVYDAAHYVGEQLRSVLAQSVLPTQVVVGDDGSTDGSVEVVAALRDDAVARGLDITWTVLDHSRHLGFRENMRRTLAACTGDVVVVCDHDDVCLPDRLGRVLAWFAEHPQHLMVCTDAVVVDGTGATTAPSMMARRQLSAGEQALLRSDRAFELLVRRFVAEGTVSAYRRELLEMVPPCPEAVVYDAWLALLASAMERFGYDERPSVLYRSHGANLSGGAATRTRADKLRMLLEPGGDRNERWHSRTAAVLAGVQSLGSDVPGWAYELAAASARHQEVRARFPVNRALRAPFVLRHAASGAYSRSARGYKDVLLDLVQPVG